MVDGSAIGQGEGGKRQRRSIAEKRRIVELAMQPGASVARVAQQHGVNANQVHYWRKLYQQGRLGEVRADSVRLLPVRVSESAATAVLEPATAPVPTSSITPAPATGTIYIEFPKIHLRVESGADAALLRVVLETLQR
jgi:transposase